MNTELATLQVQHEKIRLEKRAIDRKTEDVRTKEIGDRRKNKHEIEVFQIRIQEKKELVATCNQKNNGVKGFAQNYLFYVIIRLNYLIF